MVLVPTAAPVISIHSTTRVETKVLSQMSQPHGYFNPLHHEGGDILRVLQDITKQDFNPLHHEGGDAVPASPSHT